MLPPTTEAGQPSVYFPVDRVVCDRKGWACYDPLGASVPLTKAHLGDQAARILETRMAKIGKGWNPNHFVLSTGVECFVEKKTCYVRVGSEEVEPAVTKQLFGSR
jgi:Fels-1 Prophage Protein-like.